MDFVFGIRGPDFVLLCSDTAAVNQIITIKQDEDKIIPIDSHRAMAVSGESGDRVQFSEFIIANVRLYALRQEPRVAPRQDILRLAVVWARGGGLTVCSREKDPWHPPRSLVPCARVGG